MYILKYYNPKNKKWIECSPEIDTFMNAVELAKKIETVQQIRPFVFSIENHRGYNPKNY